MTISGDYHHYPSGLFRPETIAVTVLPRVRLISQIVGPDARKVTLVAAPLGYGKTVLLTQAYDAYAREGRRCLWLSIRGEVGDSSLLGLLWAAADHAGVPAAPRTAITVNGLLSRLEDCAEPICIIVDCLNQDLLNSAHVTLWQLIHGAPHGTSFLIATENALHLPLVRLEAAGLLRKIGASDLALNDADITALGRITMLPAWISLLNARVEGWPAIIQLALGRFREEPTSPPRLSGSQHDIAAFLEHEILRTLQANELARLLDASVVDEICGSLLDALSGGNDSSVILGTLVARGIPVRESTRYGWFRLHPLLREYLHDRLQRHLAGRLTLLHQRAANWLLAYGDEQGAIRHATTTGDIDFLRTIYQRLNVTPALLPDHDERLLVEEAPSGASSDTTSDPKWRKIFDCIESGRLDQARIAIAEARRQAPVRVGPAPSDIPPVEWELTYGELLMKVFDDRLPRPDQLEALRDSLMRTPGVPPSIPAAVSELVIVSRFRRGDLSGMADADPNLWHTSALAPPQSKIYVLLELGIAALELGDLDRAGRHLRNAKARALQAFGPQASQAYAAATLLAEIALERGDQTGAAQLLADSFPHLHSQEVWFNLAASALTSASTLAARRSWGDALNALELPRSLSAHVGLWRLPPLMVVQRLRLACLWSEDIESARRDRATLSGLGLLDLGELDGAGFGWRVAVPAQLAVIRFDLADHKAEAALARSLALRPILETRRHARRLVELNLLQGRAAIDMGDRAVGCTLIRAALRQSIQSGMVQCFLDEARFLDTVICELLLAQDISVEERIFLDRPSIQGARPSVRPMRYVANGRTFELSSREAQLLRALVTGKTFKEISFAMNISVNTTKMHRTRLYRKLGCNSRSHAIALAQELVAT